MFLLVCAQSRCDIGGLFLLFVCVVRLLMDCLTFLAASGVDSIVVPLRMQTTYIGGFFAG